NRAIDSVNVRSQLSVSPLEGAVLRPLHPFTAVAVGIHEASHVRRLGAKGMHALRLRMRFQPRDMESQKLIHLRPVGGASEIHEPSRPAVFSRILLEEVEVMLRIA